MRCGCPDSSKRSVAADLRAIVACLVVGLISLLGRSPANAAPPSAGELVYRQGVLPSGRSLRGEREAGGGVDGANAACATCHRRSGLGSWEGQTVIPPLAGYRGNSPPMQSTRGVMYRVERRWQLHVWELSGPPETWDRQLRKWLAATPVFAVISGIGGRSWASVHRFCEREAIPCLLPNVDLPTVAEQDCYPIYFSKGVLLEAELIARQLGQTRGRPAIRRMVQVFRQGDIGAEAARALAGVATGYSTTARVLGSGDAQKELVAALEDIGAGDAVILWLRPADLRALPAAPAPAAAVYASGLMAGMERSSLSATWRRVTRLTYPLSLPDLRKVQMNFPLGWFNVRHIPVLAERVQTDTYLACVIVSETVGHMLDSFVRDYLVERIEVMLSHRLVNAHYPRLGLAPGQRFASKGGYIVHFAQAVGTRLIADSDWMVP